VNFSVAYLDYQRSEQEPYRESLAATFRLGDSEAKPDVLIVDSIEAVRFMTQYRDKILPGVTMVFYGSAQARGGAERREWVLPSGLAIARSSSDRERFE
jgi:hypothetical protein